MSEQRVRDKLDAFVREGKFYEAEQMYHTLFARMNVQKKFAANIELMTFGVLQLLEHKQVSSAAELGKLLIDVYTLSQTSAQDDTVIANIVKVFDAFCNTQPLDVEKCVEFMHNAIKWSQKAGAGTLGHPALHFALARFHLTLQDFVAAQRHFCRSALLAVVDNQSMLQSWFNAVSVYEQDLLIARVVLQYLSVENLNGANQMLAFGKQLMSDANSKPILNFAGFLLQTCERDAPPLFEMLREKYAVALERDPAFSTLLDRIGKSFFNIKPQATGLQGLLGDLLGGDQ